MYPKSTKIPKREKAWGNHAQKGENFALQFLGNTFFRPMNKFED